LLIGVQDNGTILGIENDYNTLDKSKQSKDGFMLKFGQIINKYLGKRFNEYLSTKVIKLEKKPVCIVEISKSEDPVFIIKGNQEQFYIRGPAGSEPMSISETMNYIKSHWQSKE